MGGHALTVEQWVGTRFSENSFAALFPHVRETHFDDVLGCAWTRKNVSQMGKDGGLAQFSANVTKISWRRMSLQCSKWDIHTHTDSFWPPPKKKALFAALHKSLSILGGPKTPPKSYTNKKLISLVRYFETGIALCRQRCTVANDLAVSWATVVKLFSENAENGGLYVPTDVVEVIWRYSGHISEGPDDVFLRDSEKLSYMPSETALHRAAKRLQQREKQSEQWCLQCFVGPCECKGQILSAQAARARRAAHGNT